MALQLIKISEFPQEETLASVEWLPVGRIDGEAFKISFEDFVNNFEIEVTGTFRADSFADL